MWEKQTLPQRLHLCVVSGVLELMRFFLQALFSTSVFTSFSSPDVQSAFPPLADGCKVLPGLHVVVLHLHHVNGVIHCVRGHSHLLWSLVQLHCAKGFLV